jgi:hypothetical protein
MCSGLGETAPSRCRGNSPHCHYGAAIFEFHDIPAGHFEEAGGLEILNFPAIMHLASVAGALTFIVHGFMTLLSSRWTMDLAYLTIGKWNGY